MKAQPLRLTEHGYDPCEASEATHLMLNMPGPLPTRILPVITHGTRRGTPCWTWNGDTEKPTLKPSILTRGGPADAEIRCHTFVNDGMVQFLSDCTHELKDQTVPLLEVDY